MSQPTPPNTTKNAMQIRMMGIAGTGNEGSIITVDEPTGRTKSGFFRIGFTGTTPQRPDGSVQGVGLNINEHYYDTTISALIVWDGRNWRLPSTGAVV